MEAGDFLRIYPSKEFVAFAGHPHKCRCTDVAHAHGNSKSTVTAS